MQEIDALDDETLIRRSRERPGPDADACLNVLYRRHHRKVAAWCLRIRKPGSDPTGSGPYGALRDIREPSWTLLTSLAGDGTLRSVNDPISSPANFYLVVASP